MQKEDAAFSPNLVINTQEVAVFPFRLFCSRFFGSSEEKQNHVGCFEIEYWRQLALIAKCLVVGTAKTPAGHTTGLASPEPDTGVGRSLVSRLQTHDEAGTGYVGRDLLLVDSEEMF